MKVKQTDAENEVLRRFLEAAVDLLKHGNMMERAAAAGVLGTLGTEAVVPALLETLQKDKSRQVQHKSSQAIARIGGSKAIAGLQDLMRNDNQYTRFLAAEALADIVSRGTL